MVAKKAIKLQLKQNDKGTDVKIAQQMLAKLGSTIKPSGIYSIGMVSAVKSFQKKNGLKITGVIDTKTWDKLKELTTIKKTGGRKK